MSRTVTVTLNDREAKRVDIIKSWLKCKDEAAIVIMMCACSKTDIERALRLFTPQTEPTKSVGV